MNTAFIQYPEEVKRNYILRRLHANNLGLMKIRCCACGLDMGEKICSRSNDGFVSHGYCEKCLKAVKAQIENSKKES